MNRKNSDYKFKVGVTYYQDGKKQMSEGSTDNIIEFAEMLKSEYYQKYSNWVYLNVFYQYKINGKHKYGQITSFTNRYLPNSVLPTETDVKRFVMMINRVNPNGLNFHDLEAIEQYCKDVLLCPLFAVGVQH